MSTYSPPIAVEPDEETRKLVRWSAFTIVVFGVTFFITDLIGARMLPVLGLHEGDLLLMQRGFAGWALEIAFAVILAAPAALGVKFAINAMRRHARWSAWTVLAMNAALVLVTVYMFVDAVLMTYYPHLR